ncbi:uncharacterized protein LOC101452284 isoform X1 [Ceratitis capitata]|uniref:uncharacterized protein LOC101452284 isoform X1 n=2 Tax=Ceratitis capitata TaxID=7213 RepID=UPI000A0F6DC8|nr:uncharacterized protein LOC101452284 isoform X1 [Ceratitis capitata]
MKRLEESKKFHNPTDVINLTNSHKIRNLQSCCLVTMAPTICQDKKPRQIRANLKEIRRQPNTANALLSALTTTAGSGQTTRAHSSGNGSDNATITAGVINYVSTAPNTAALRLRDTLNTDAVEIPQSDSMRVDRLDLEDGQHIISENLVSSSNMGPELVRALIADQMEMEMDMEHSDIFDEEDCEVHSINSGARYCHNHINNINKNNSNHLLQCNVKTMFPLSDKKINKSNEKLNYNQQKRTQHYISAEEDTDNESNTYTSMCELKKTEGLLSIALKTIKLVKRNQMLQRRLAQLQFETSEFIESVMANPENRHFRNKISSPALSPSAPTTPVSPASPSSSSLASPSAAQISSSSPLQSSTTTTRA